MDETRGKRVAAALADFSARPPARGPGGDPEWPVELFHRAAGSVPAYREFLREHGADPATVRTLDGFARLPLMTKENYHTKYPLAERCRDGRLDSCDMIAVSSGSTGHPTYWPRFVLDELSVATRFEQVFRDSFGADSTTTLAVVCFPLGTWVGGLYTAACCRHLAAKGYPITVVAPGNNKDEILRVVPDLAAGFGQTVLLGYPPFLKDLVDTGNARGIGWPAMNIKLVLAGEVFSEDWRDLMGERAGMTRPAYDSAALYGTADGGVLGNETPLSITVRRFLARTPDAAQELFGSARLPTLVQYDPASRYFEQHDGTLLFTADSGVPLIRYHIADEGGLVAYEDVLALCREAGFDPLAGLGPRAAANRLPFAFIFGRSHLAVSFFGANVYPENVSAGLEQPSVSPWVTGKFVLEVVEDADRNRRLAVAVELAPGEDAAPGRTGAAADSILTQLRRLNSEFAHYVPPEYQAPRITLLPAGDPDYFPAGVKHRYTRK
jgi:phenylacetate-CoA ligase